MLDKYLESLTKEASSKGTLKRALQNLSFGELAKLAGVKLAEDVCTKCGSHMPKKGEMYKCACGMMKHAGAAERALEVLRPYAMLADDLPILAQKTGLFRSDDKKHALKPKTAESEGETPQAELQSRLNKITGKTIETQTNYPKYKDSLGEKDNTGKGEFCSKNKEAGIGLSLLNLRSNAPEAAKSAIKLFKGAPPAALKKIIKGAPPAAQKALAKAAAKHDMPHFLDQDRPKKVKEIYKALKRDHPDMPAEMKARIAARKGKKSHESRKSPKDGGPKYKAPLHFKRKGEKYVAKHAGVAGILSNLAIPAAIGSAAGIHRARQLQDPERSAVPSAALGGLGGVVGAPIGQLIGAGAGTLAGALSGSAIGALVNAIRRKSLVDGMLAGSLRGGVGGALLGVWPGSLMGAYHGGKILGSVAATPKKRTDRTPQDEESPMGDEAQKTSSVKKAFAGGLVAGAKGLTRGLLGQSAKGLTTGMAKPLAGTAKTWMGKGQAARQFMGQHPIATGAGVGMVGAAGGALLRGGGQNQTVKIGSDESLVEIIDQAGRVLAKVAGYNDVKIEPEDLEGAIEEAQSREDIPGRSRAWQIGGGLAGAAAGLGAGALLGGGAGNLLSRFAKPSAKAVAHAKRWGRRVQFSPETPSTLMGGVVGAPIGAGVGGYFGQRAGKQHGAEEAAADKAVSLLRALRAHQAGQATGFGEGLRQGSAGRGLSEKNSDFGEE